MSNEFSSPSPLESPLPTDEQALHDPEMLKQLINEPQVVYEQMVAADPTADTTEIGNSINNRRDEVGRAIVKPEVVVLAGDTNFNSQVERFEVPLGNIVSKTKEVDDDIQQADVLLVETQYFISTAQSHLYQLEGALNDGAHDSEYMRQQTQALDGLANDQIVNQGRLKDQYANARMHAVHGTASAEEAQGDLRADTRRYGDDLLDANNVPLNFFDKVAGKIAEHSGSTLEQYHDASRQEIKTNETALESTVQVANKIIGMTNDLRAKLPLDTTLEGMPEAHMFSNALTPLANYVRHLEHSRSTDQVRSVREYLDQAQSVLMQMYQASQRLQGANADARASANVLQEYLGQVRSVLGKNYTSAEQKQAIIQLAPVEAPIYLPPIAEELSAVQIEMPPAVQEEPVQAATEHPANTEIDVDTIPRAHLLTELAKREQVKEIVERRLHNGHMVIPETGLYDLDEARTRGVNGKVLAVIELPRPLNGERKPIGTANLVAVIDYGEFEAGNEPSIASDVVKNAENFGKAPSRYVVMGLNYLTPEGKRPIQSLIHESPVEIGRTMATNKQSEPIDEGIKIANNENNNFVSRKHATVTIGNKGHIILSDHSTGGSKVTIAQLR
jgi:hypothetical protein